MLGASPAPAWLPQELAPSTAVQVQVSVPAPLAGCPSRGAAADGLWAAEDAEVWLCVPVKTSLFAAGRQFPCKMPVKVPEGLPPRSCCLCARDL